MNKHYNDPKQGDVVWAVHFDIRFECLLLKKDPFTHLWAVDVLEPDVQRRLETHRFGATDPTLAEELQGSCSGYWICEHEILGDASK